MFFQIVFEGIKIVNTLECVRGFIPKSWTNARQSKLPVVNLAKRTTYYLNVTLRSDIKDFTQIIRALLVEILKNN